MAAPGEAAREIPCSRCHSGALSQKNPRLAGGALVAALSEPSAAACITGAGVSLDQPRSLSIGSPRVRLPPQQLPKAPCAGPKDEPVDNGLVNGVCANRRGSPRCQAAVDS